MTSYRDTQPSSLITTSLLQSLFFPRLSYISSRILFFSFFFRPSRVQHALDLRTTGLTYYSNCHPITILPPPPPRILTLLISLCFPRLSCSAGFYVFTASRAQRVSARRTTGRTRSWSPGRTTAPGRGPWPA